MIDIDCSSGVFDKLAETIQVSAGTVVDLNQEIALAAAALSIESRLPMADSIILATAQVHGATLWTQDEHFQGMAGVAYIAKP